MFVTSIAHTYASATNKCFDLLKAVVQKTYNLARQAFQNISNIAQSAYIYFTQTIGLQRRVNLPNAHFQENPTRNAEGMPIARDERTADDNRPATPFMEPAEVLQFLQENTINPQAEIPVLDRTVDALMGRELPAPHLSATPNAIPSIPFAREQLMSTLYRSSSVPIHFDSAAPNFRLADYRSPSPIPNLRAPIHAEQPFAPRQGQKSRIPTVRVPMEAASSHDSPDASETDSSFSTITATTVEELDIQIPVARAAAAPLETMRLWLENSDPTTQMRAPLIHSSHNTPPPAPQETTFRTSSVPLPSKKPTDTLSDTVTRNDVFSTSNSIETQSLPNTSTRLEATSPVLRPHSSGPSIADMLRQIKVFELINGEWVRC